MPFPAKGLVLLSGISSTAAPKRSCGQISFIVSALAAADLDRRHQEPGRQCRHFVVGADDGAVTDRYLAPEQDTRAVIDLGDRHSGRLAAERIAAQPFAILEERGADTHQDSAGQGQGEAFAEGKFHGSRVAADFAELLDHHLHALSLVPNLENGSRSVLQREAPEVDGQRIHQRLLGLAFEGYRRRNLSLSPSIRDDPVQESAWPQATALGGFFDPPGSGAIDGERDDLRHCRVLLLLLKGHGGYHSWERSPASMLRKRYQKGNMDRCSVAIRSPISGSHHVWRGRCWTNTSKKKIPPRIGRFLAKAGPRALISRRAMPFAMTSPRTSSRRA